MKDGAALQTMLAYDLLNVECASSNLRRDDHELLECQTSTSVGTMRCQRTNIQLSELPDCLPSVKNVHEWDRENIRLLSSGKIGNVSVKWDTLLLSVRQADDCKNAL